MIDYRDDMALGQEIVTRIAEAYRKIRNTARYLLSNLSDFDPATDAVPVGELHDVDRWILSRAAQAFARCRQAYDEYEFHTVYHRVLDLCTVDLSAIYLDLSKDNVYIEAPDSPARRSAQTAMYEILRALVTTIAPILSFTAEEIYEHLPGEHAASVHLTDFVTLDVPPLSAEETASWERIFTLREAVSKVLERARANREIGQSLEADITLYGELTPEALRGSIDVDLAKVFIVSHVDFAPANDAIADAVELPGIGRVGLAVARARGKKCGRCWNYKEEVTADGDACARCSAILDTLAPTETPTV
jgi:isoleucyl-tRNA synthetase